MISIVLYGRNDSYGYNLHKRAALSLNCMAELLTDANDEILFVDYNTPDDFPTFPEAIQDTLTEKAKERLRILRVRPSIHARFKDRTHLQALEPVARNIAIRRSNPANRWILSTNTDMIFVPRNGQSLSDIVRDLPDGYFGIPRFEIPESLWECLDRYDAPGTIRTVGEWGWNFHLNEIVYGAPTIKFDAPGDFQLISRGDLHRIHGFNEQMLLGWHVDSNICKRLFTIYGQVGDLSGRLFGYHCDHTRQVTPMHRRTAVENSLAKFVDQVKEPTVPEQADSWGCPDADIEITSIATCASQSYLSALRTTLPRAMTVPTEVAYIRESYDEVSYDASHVLPYLMDVLSSAPRHWSVAWFGIHESIFKMFCAAWREMGFIGRIHVASDLYPVSQTQDAALFIHPDTQTAISQANTFIVDLSGPSGEALGFESDTRSSAQILGLIGALNGVVRAELDLSAQPKWTPRRIIAINAIHNRFEPLMRGYIEFARSPFSGRLRHGYVVLNSGGMVPWLELMTMKVTGTRVGSTAAVRSGGRGQVISGPHVSVLPGRYSVTLDLGGIGLSGTDWIRLPLGLVKDLAALLTGWRTSSRAQISTASGSAPRWKKHGALAVEIRDGERILLRKSFSILGLLLRRRYRLRFEVRTADLAAPEPSAINVRLWSGGWIPFTVRRLDIDAVKTG
jgi:hypothetical protein